MLVDAEDENSEWPRRQWSSVRLSLQRYSLCRSSRLYSASRRISWMSKYHQDIDPADPHSLPLAFIMSLDGTGPLAAGLALAMVTRRPTLGAMNTDASLSVSRSCAVQRSQVLTPAPHAPHQRAASHSTTSRSARRRPQPIA